MAGNRALGKAKGARNDEFYTQLADIEKELRHYKRHFKGKTVLCNCDDPFESKFFEYFAKKFNSLGLKKLIATCYATSPIAGRRLSISDIDPGAEPGTPYKAVVTKVYDKTGDGYVDMFDVRELFLSGENELTELTEDGDFRSPECLELLDEADIVVTNPPFSLFREYVAVLMAHEKDFIIIGNQNAITYKEFFPLLMQNKVWLGYMAPKEFVVPRDVEDRKNVEVREDGTVVAKFGNVCWFTNLDHKKRHEEIDLYKRYSVELYPKYDNYNAVEVGRVADIPCDYPGLMGVPITFLDKYSPDQFEIVMLANGNSRTNTAKEVLDAVAYVPTNGDKGGLGMIDGKRVYARILIRNLHPEKPRT